ncbi:MAG: class I SAM-dependent methyltransferase [Geminicoccaceae bacterium]
MPDADTPRDAADCPVCRSEAQRRPAVRLPYGRISTCAACGSGILEPRPGRVRLGELHGSDDYFNHPYFEQRRQVTVAAAAEARLRRIEAVTGPLDGKRLVDVGCDIGQFVDFAQTRRGMVATGVDIFSRVVEIGRAEGRDLHVGTLDQVGFEAADVDVVTGFDLIEHVDDPVDFLGEVHRILKPGGVVSLETPNYGGLIYRVGRALDRLSPIRPVLKTLQARLWPPFHVQYFTKDSLARRLSDSGFKVLSVEGRELTGDELAIAQPFLRAGVSGLLRTARIIRMPTVLDAVAVKI